MKSYGFFESTHPASRSCRLVLQCASPPANHSMLVLAARAARVRTRTLRKTLSTYASPHGTIAAPNQSFTEYVAAKVATHDPAKPMLVDALSGQTLTFGEFAPRVARAAERLRSVAATPFGAGSTLLIHSPNCVDFPVAFHAALALGGVVSTSNPLYTPRELAHQITDCGASHILTVGAFEQTVKDAVALSGSQATVGVLGTSSSICQDEAEGEGSTFALTDASRTGLAQDVIEESTPFDASSCLAALPYSSGTTGLPKGVMLTHGNLVANLEQTYELVKRARPDLLGDKDVLLGLLPMFHIYGMVTILHYSMIHGSTLVTLPNFEPETFLKAIAQHQVNVAHLVPPLILFLAKHPAVKPEMIASLQCIMSGAAPLDAHTQQEASTRIDCEVIQGYGMTETSPVLTIDCVKGGVPGAAGQLVPSTEAALKIADPASSTGFRDAASGEEGELWCRGPQVMAGYLNRPDATAETLVDGFVRTGDIATVDGEGNFFIVDRVKELIKVKGLQVAPAELEGLLLTHPCIADAGVVGEPDARTPGDERPHAFVVLKPDAELSAVDVTNFIAGLVATYKHVKAVTFVSEIPKSASGKILRRVLRDRLKESA